MLGNAEIRRVHKPENHMIPQARKAPFCRLLFQSGQMVNPFLIALRYQRRECQLFDYIGVIVCEVPPQQAPHILKDERLWRYFPHGANGLWKHIAAVGGTEVFAAERKWLAWWPTNNYVNLPSMPGKVIFPHVLFKDIPVPCRRNVVSLVSPQSGAREAVEINHGFMLEPRMRCAYRKSTGSDE